MHKHNTTLTPTAKRRGRPVNHSAPFCVACRERMKSSGSKGSRWLCQRCDHSFYKQTAGELRGTGDAVKNHPFCVKCRNRMAKHSQGVWRCTHCKRYANAHRTQTQTRRECPTRRIASRKPILKLDHAQCVACRWQMKHTGAAKARWECYLCGASCKVFGPMQERKPSPPKSDNGGDLIAFIDSKLTGYSVEMREELRGEIAIALLTHAKIGGLRLTRASLTAATVREIAKPIFKQQPNRFRDVSLDHQYGEDGQRLEERLVG